jgi:hypothetical protein
MTTADLLTDAFGRIRKVVHDAVDGLSPDQLSLRPAAQANSITSPMRQAPSRPGPRTAGPRGSACRSMSRKLDTGMTAARPKRSG